MLNKKMQITLCLGTICCGVTIFAGCANDRISGQINEKSLVINNVIEEKSELDKIKEVVAEQREDLAVLVNKENPLDGEYKPDDLVLVDVNRACSKGAEQSYMREEAARALEEMFKVAESEGINLYLVSGFRSSGYQNTLYNISLRDKGKEHTEKYMAKPNYSEHQTGLAVDISSESKRDVLETEFKDSKEGIWLEKNAHKFGFILRYKEGRELETGYEFEPWHFRYVGKDVSEYIYKNDLILEELY